MFTARRKGNYIILLSVYSPRSEMKVQMHDITKVGHIYCVKACMLAIISGSSLILGAKLSCHS